MIFCLLFKLYLNVMSHSRIAAFHMRGKEMKRDIGIAIYSFSLLHVWPASLNIYGATQTFQ